MGSQHTAASCGNTILLPAAHMIPLEQFKEVMKCFGVLMHQARHITKQGRSAARDEQGHQKTPAFVSAVLEDAFLKCQHDAIRVGDKAFTQTKGGFTDVGLHTGGLPRDTSWALVCATVEVSALKPYSKICFSK